MEKTDAQDYGRIEPVVPIGTPKHMETLHDAARTPDRVGLGLVVGALFCSSTVILAKEAIQFLS